MKIISHRGNGNKHKENTIEALNEALKKEYIDGVELDVRMTKDYKFVLSHEPFFSGKLIGINKYKNLKIPLLDDFLNSLSTDKIIMIDVKEEMGREEKLVSCLVKCLNKYNLNLYICSFNYKIIKLFKSKFKRGLIISSKINEDKIKNEFDFNSLHYKIINKKSEKETFVWTVNKEMNLPKCNIITDRPLDIYTFFFSSKMLPK